MTKLNRSTAAGLLVVLIATLVLIFVSRIDRGLAVFWFFGLAFGFVLQRSRFCFASAFRDLFLLRHSRVMRGITAGMATATIGFAVLMTNLVPNPLLGTLPPDAHVTPLGLNTVLGGLVFGLGMVLAGGCVSGSMYRMGEGYIASWVTFSGIVFGLFLSTHTWNWWWSVHIGQQPLVWLPRFLGYGGAIGLTLLGLLASYLLVLWWESRGGLVTPEVRSERPPEETFVQKLRDLWQIVFVEGWPVVTGGLLLGTLNVFLYVFHQPWGISGNLSTWADRGASLLGLSAGPLLGVEQISGCALTSGHEDLLSNNTMLNAGLISGALIGALLAGEFKVRVPRQRLRYGQSLAGGVLMGYGAGIAFGCTIGAFFSAIPSLGLNGWVYGLSLAVGAYLGVQIIQRLP